MILAAAPKGAKGNPVIYANAQPILPPSIPASARSIEYPPILESRARLQKATISTANTRPQAKVINDNVS